MQTYKLTVAQALLKFLQQQYVVLDEKNTNSSKVFGVFWA